MYNVREVELKVCIKHSVLHNINTHLIETPLPKMLVIPLLLNQITFCFFPLYVLRKASHNKSVTYSQRLSLCLCVAEKNHHVSRFPSFTLKITNYYMHKRPLVENLAQVSHSLLSSYFRRGLQVYLTGVRRLLGP